MVANTGRQRCHIFAFLLKDLTYLWNTLRRAVCLFRKNNTPCKTGILKHHFSTMFTGLLPLTDPQNVFQIKYFRVFFCNIFSVVIFSHFNLWIILMTPWKALASFKMDAFNLPALSKMDASKLSGHLTSLVLPGHKKSNLKKFKHIDELFF